MKLLTTYGEKQMMKFMFSTGMLNDNDKIILSLNDVIEIDKDSVFFRILDSNNRSAYKRVGAYEIFISKKNRNFLLTKFYVKGNVELNGEKVMNMLVTTNEKPYKVELYFPTFLQKFTNKDEFKMNIDYNPGKSLEIFTNGERFTGLSIRKNRNDDEIEVTINTHNRSTVFYVWLTDDFFKTFISLPHGDWLEPKLTWKGLLPKNRKEALDFFLENNIKVDATGSNRNFKIDLNWKFNRITAESLNLSFNWAGNGPNWGDYTISKEMSCKVADNVIDFLTKGDASFTKGVFSTASPIKTDIHFKYMIYRWDLIGKASGISNGKKIFDLSFI